MSEALVIDEIVLRVPASAAHARIVRVGAAAIALRQGMSFTEIDELRAAVDEALALLLAPPADGDTVICCRFRARAGSLELEARRSDGAAVPAPALSRFNDALGRSDVTATVEPREGRLLLHKKHRGA